MERGVAPASPGIYALYSGRDVAYVGKAVSVRSRIDQHLVLRNSSITTGVAAVSLNPDLLTEVRWWTDARFADALNLAAAELVAFDVLQPVLRSRGGVSQEARALAADREFRATMVVKFTGPSSGHRTVLRLEAALGRLTELERRVALLEAAVAEVKRGAQP
jgi:hypothetical protein